MDTRSNIHKTAQIVFFSGTGGVQRVALAFEHELIHRGLDVSLNALDASLPPKGGTFSDQDNLSADLVFLLFPIHAFDAPDPIFEWIRNTHMEKKNIAVISASAAGEKFPNTGCRIQVCKSLEAKGFNVIYEKMMCMPSNWVMTESDQVTMWMIGVIPHKVKVDRILDDVLAGNIRRTPCRKGAFKSLIPVEKCCKGFLWKDIRNYLLDKDENECSKRLPEECI